MKMTLPLGRVGGILVRVDWSALLTVALVGTMLARSVLPAAVPGRSVRLYWAVSIPTAILFFACLLAHELAHSLVARRNGVGVRSVTLWMLGGRSELDRDAPDARSDLAIAAAGPLASLVLGLLLGTSAVASTMAGLPLLVGQSLLWLAVLNVFLAVFNMLPGAPLDGGRVVRAILWRRYDDLPRADLAAARAGGVLGRVVIASGMFELGYGDLAGGIWTILIGFFLIGSAKAERTSRQLRVALDGLIVSDVMHRLPDRLMAWHSVATAVRQTVADSEQSVFPVVDFNGSPVGCVALERLVAVRPEQREQLRIQAVMTPLPSQNVLPADAPASRILQLQPVNQLVAVVTDEAGSLVGTITAADRERIIQRCLLSPR